MILTCPSCSKRFVLPAKLLAPEGRTVKCSACEEEWFQLPDPDELLEDLEHEIEETQDESPETDETPSEAQEDAAEDVNEGDDGLPDSILDEDIPDAVKPIPETKSVPALQNEGAASKKASVIAYVAAAAIFLLISGALVFLKAPIVKSWPPSAALYEMAGMAVSVPGEGLVFDRVQISASRDVLNVEGLIINLKNEAQAIPMIEANLINTNGEMTGHWYIQPPAGMLNPEMTLPFKAQYQGDIQGIETVKLRFVLSTSPKAPAAGHDEAAHEEAHP